MENKIRISHFWLILALLLAFGAYICKDVLFPFVVGAFVAYMVAPFVNKLSQKFNRTLVSFVVTVFIMGALIALLWTFIPFWNREIKSLIKNAPIYISNISDFVTVKAQELKSLGFDIEVFKTDIQKYALNNVNLVVEFLLKLISKGDIITNFFSALVIIPITMFYILKDWEKLNKKLFEIIPIRSRKDVLNLQQRIRKCIQSFMNGQMIVVAILSGYYIPCLTFLQIENNVFWGIVSGVASFIPFLGAVFCCLIVSFINILSGFSFMKAMIIISVYLIGQFFEGYILSPKFVGNEVNIHPLLLLFAFFVGINLGGVFGVLICIPSMAVMIEIIRFFVAKFRESNFFKQN